MNKHKYSSDLRQPGARIKTACDDKVATSVRRVDSDAILGGCIEVEILHGRDIYRLRHTSTGKLILTK
jgi:hemin uptake protein HemP